MRLLSKTEPGGFATDAGFSAGIGDSIALNGFYEKIFHKKRGMFLF